MHIPAFKKLSFHMIPPGKIRGNEIALVTFDANTKMVFAGEKYIGNGFIEQQVIIIPNNDKRH
jgi:hypothetical protein